VEGVNDVVGGENPWTAANDSGCPHLPVNHGEQLQARIRLRKSLDVRRKPANLVRAETRSDLIIALKKVDDGISCL